MQIMARPEVSGNPRLVELIKEYYVRGIVMMEASSVGTTEAYKRRMQDALDQLNIVGTRIAVEAGVQPPYYWQ